jgi:ribosomal protein S18 acetylase RimI-like enzyme
MLTIRKLISSDYEIFYNMRIKMLESSSQNYTAGLHDWKNASKEQIVAFLKESEGPSDNFVLGAFSGELVGMVGFRSEVRESLRHKGNTWGLFEDSNFQQLNIEEALLKAVIESTRTYSDFEYIRTVQNASSYDKLKLFLSFGFKEYGREERSLRVGEKYYDQVYLKLIVADGSLSDK